jgi:hypothetical protein
VGGEFKIVRDGGSYNIMLNTFSVNSCSYWGTNRATDDAYTHTSSLAVPLPARGLMLKAKLHVYSTTLFVMLLIFKGRTNNLYNNSQIQESRYL